MPLETAVVEGEPAFRWTDFLIGTEVEATGSDGVRFIFLIMFRFIVCLLFGRYFVQKLNQFFFPETVNINSKIIQKHKQYFEDLLEILDFRECDRIGPSKRS
jgi:hypothetical protein